MNLFKRSCIFLVRNIKRIISLFLVVFVLGNMMCIVSSIKTASSSVSDIIRQNVGSIVIYKDIRFNNMNYEIKSDEDLKELYSYEQSLIKMMDHQSVQYANYSYMTKLEDKKGDLHHGYGISSYPMVDVLENKLRIVEGREFNEDEINNGKYVLLVEKGSIYDGKEIKLNDEIPMSIHNDVVECNENYGCELLVKNGEDYTLKVVGLFEKIDKVFDNQNQEYQNISNRWYVPNKTLVTIFENKLSISDYSTVLNSFNLAIDTPLIRLKDSDNLNTYLRDINSFLLNDKDIQGNNYDSLYISDDEYNKIYEPIHFIPVIGNILFIVSAFAFSIILCFLLISIVKERLHEIGIYLSMGEKKKKMIFQIFLELMIVSIIGISCSFATGPLLGNQILNRLVSQAVLAELDISTIQIDYIYFIIYVYGYSCLILIIALIYPTFLILKQNPKDILLK